MVYQLAMKTKQNNKNQKHNQTKTHKTLNKNNPYIKKNRDPITRISGEILLTTAKVILQCKKTRTFYRLR